MNALRINAHLLVVLGLCAAGALGLSACATTDNTNTTTVITAPANTAATNTTTTTRTTTTTAATPASTTATGTPTTTATPAATTAATGDKIGVEECDDYLAKYETCIDSKVPAAARATLKASFAQTRNAWRTTAATPEGRAGLAQACKAATTAAKQATAAYGCTW